MSRWCPSASLDSVDDFVVPFVSIRRTWRGEAGDVRLAEAVTAAEVGDRGAEAPVACKTAMQRFLSIRRVDRFANRLEVDVHVQPR